MLVPYILKVLSWSKTLPTLEKASPFHDMILSLIKKKYKKVLKPIF